MRLTETDRLARVVDLTRSGVEHLFGLGCSLVLLACNTATAVACRTLQQQWLPDADWPGRNVLGIVAPTVEAATQTPWAVQTPQYPQKHNRDVIAVFGTTRTVASDVYPEEIRKRCPDVRVFQQSCPTLVSAIERGADEAVLDEIVAKYVRALRERTGDVDPDRAILGCTHYPLVQHLFHKHLPAQTRILAQPDAVTYSLEDYLQRHPHYATPKGSERHSRLLTTGDPNTVSARVSLFMPDNADFGELSGGGRT